MLDVIIVALRAMSYRMLSPNAVPDPRVHTNDWLFKSFEKKIKLIILKPRLIRIELSVIPEKFTGVILN